MEYRELFAGQTPAMADNKHNNDTLAMAEIIQNNDAMRKVDEVAMVRSSALTDASSTLTGTEVFMEQTVDKPESPRDLHLVSEYPSTQTRRAGREKPKVLPKPKLRAPQEIDPPQGNCSGDVQSPNNKPKTLPKPNLNVAKEIDPQRDSLREQSGSPKEKPPKPRLNVPRNVGQPNDMTTEDVVTAKETDQSKDDCTRDVATSKERKEAELPESHSTGNVATPKEGKEIDEVENYSTGDVATPMENDDSLAKADSKCLQLAEQPTKGKHGDNAVMQRGKPTISPKLTLNNM